MWHNPKLSLQANFTTFSLNIFTLSLLMKRNFKDFFCKKHLYVMHSVRYRTVKMSVCVKKIVTKATDLKTEFLKSPWKTCVTLWKTIPGHLKQTPQDSPE